MKVGGKMHTCVSAPSTGAGLKVHNKLLLGLLLGTLFALGGCASTDDSKPDWAGVKGSAEPAKLVDFKQTAKFEVRWHSDIGDQGPDILQIALTKDAIYCACLLYTSDAADE